MQTLPSVPAVIESLPKKTQELVSTLKNLFGPAFAHVMQKKEVRAGKGKRRSRKYKSNAGLLIITGNKEKMKSSGLEIKTVREVSIIDLYPLGRLTLYTKQALEELNHVA